MKRKIWVLCLSLLTAFCLLTAAACGGGGDNDVFTVSFDSRGGSAVAAIENVESGSAIEAPAAPSRAGYAFGGWFKSAGDFTEGNAWSFEEDVVDADITLYAKWTANTYTVSFDKQGGTGDAASITVTYDGAYGTLPVLTKLGYNFGGWYTAPGGAAGGGTKVESSTAVKITANQTLFAAWLAGDAYTVVYDANKPITASTAISGTMANSEIAIGISEALRTNAYSLEGYTFGGWNTLANGGGTAYADGATVSDLGVKDAAVTLYAQWTAKTFTVTYNYNGATGGNSAPAATVTYDSNYTLAKPTRTGYTFDGWYTGLDQYGEPYTDENGASLNEWTEAYNRTLIAKWDANTYTVKYDANGGTGTMTDGTFTYGVSQALALNAFVKEDFVFMSWNSAANGGGTAYEDGQSVLNLAAVNGAEVTLYAQWCSQDTVSTKTNNNWTDEITKLGNETKDGVVNALKLKLAGGLPRFSIKPLFEESHYKNLGYNAVSVKLFVDSSTASAGTQTKGYKEFNFFYGTSGEEMVYYNDARSQYVPLDRWAEIILPIDGIFDHLNINNYAVLFWVFGDDPNLVFYMDDVRAVKTDKVTDAYDGAFNCTNLGSYLPVYYSPLMTVGRQYGEIDGVFDTIKLTLPLGGQTQNVLSVAPMGSKASYQIAGYTAFVEFKIYIDSATLSSISQSNGYKHIYNLGKTVELDKWVTWTLSLDDFFNGVNANGLREVFSVFNDTGYGVYYGDPDMVVYLAPIKVIYKENVEIPILFAWGTDAHAWQTEGMVSLNNAGVTYKGVDYCVEVAPVHTNKYLYSSDTTTLLTARGTSVSELKSLGYTHVEMGIFIEGSGTVSFLVLERTVGVTRTVTKGEWNYFTIDLDTFFAAGGQYLVRGLPETAYLSPLRVVTV